MESRPHLSLRSLVALGLFLVLAFGTAATGAFTPPGDWYAGLKRPPLTPPDWIFGPVWTLLYICIAVAGWLVWQRAGLRGARAAFAVFLAQLALNALWSVLFFGLHLPGAAVLEILALWASILATILLFWRVRPLAGALLIPYLAWVTFACYLNLGFWRLNA